MATAPKKSKQAILRHLNVNPKLVDKKEREITRHARHIKILENVSTHKMNNDHRIHFSDNPSTTGLGLTAIALSLPSWDLYHRPTGNNAEHASTAAMANHAIDFVLTGL